MNSVPKTRRDFLIDSMKIFSAVAAAPVILATFGSSIGSAEERRRGGQTSTASGGPVMVDPKDSTAQAVKYVENHKKSPESKGNKCATCTLFTKTSSKDGKEIGTCALFAGKHVYADAWCASWAKKA